MDKKCSFQNDSKYVFFLEMLLNFLGDMAKKMFFLKNHFKSSLTLVSADFARYCSCPACQSEPSSAFQCQANRNRHSAYQLEIFGVVLIIL